MNEIPAVELHPNDRQVGGAHYQAEYQHWDVIEDHGIGYLEAASSKYLTRWRGKNGLQDLEKSLHYAEKLLSLRIAKARAPRGRVPVAALQRFFDANKVMQMEQVAITDLLTWTGTSDIERAIKVIRAIIEINFGASKA